MPGFRRFSQAISEGDGISVIVPVADPGSAGAAERQGAEALVLTRPVDGLREATALPVLWRGEGGLGAAERAGADACVIVVESAAEDGDLLERLHDEALELGLDVVVDVRDEEELELALERLDPEIVLLSSREADEDQEALDRVLELLPDVPAGKLAIADVAVGGREDVVALERAGVDAVIVGAGDVAALVGGAPPEV
jgi:indole-3-glycerol phosphate synthase